MFAIQRDTEILAETTRVVVSDRLGIAKGFEDRIGKGYDFINLLVAVVGHWLFREVILQESETFFVGLGLACA